LVMENYVLDPDKVQINQFPGSLEKLSMKGSTLETPLPPTTSFFKNLDSYMPNLTCVILSNCNWVQSQSLLSLSKLPKLKELRLDSCHQIYECVAYTSLAARFGFKSLEILDVRKSPLGDGDISSFSFTSSLTHLYLENPYPPGENVQEDSDEEQPSNVNPLLGGQRIYEDDHLVQIIPNGRIDLSVHGRVGSTITDRSILMLSNRRHNDERFFLTNPNLKVLVIRNFPLVTDNSLIHLLLNLPQRFEYLDVTGTSVTKDCVNLFSIHRRNVKLVTSFDNDSNE
jgi:hypothetical protein